MADLFDMPQSVTESPARAPRTPYVRGRLFTLIADAHYKGRVVEVLAYERDVGEVRVRFPDSKGCFYVTPEQLKEVRHG